MTDNYSRIARLYDRMMEPVDRPLHQRMVALAAPDQGATVLDIGCGTGFLLDEFLDATDGSADVYGLDLSPAMLDVAEERLGARAHLTTGDATNMPYDDDMFDIVTCSLVLHELDADTAGAILSEAGRVAKPHGTVVITDYFTGSLRFKGRLWRAFSYGAEFVAGVRHFAAWRRHLRAGGVPALLPPAWSVRQQKIVAGGNLAIWACDTGSTP